MSQTLNDLPVGTKVKAVGSTFYGKDLIFCKLGPGHSQDPADSVILQTDRIITARCFDAKEPNNSDVGRQNYGNNRYAYSNLLQWLNSDAVNWYTPTHSADEKPDSDHVTKHNNVAINPYYDQAGFMNDFTKEFKKSLLEVSKKTVKNTVTDGGSYENVKSKFFLLSITEIGLGSENDIAEGEIYPLFEDSSNRSMLTTKECADNSIGWSISANFTWYWWVRTPQANTSNSLRRINGNGALDTDYASYGYIGVAPACAISKNQKVSDSVDSDGCYVLEYDPEPEIHATGSVGKFMDGVYVPFATNGGNSGFSHDDTKVNKSDIASLNLKGSINDSDSTITSGTYFYLNGSLVKAKTDIAIGGTFTKDTNYESVSVGAELISSPDIQYVHSLDVAGQHARFFKIGKLVICTVEFVTDKQYRGGLDVLFEFPHGFAYTPLSTQQSDYRFISVILQDLSSLNAYGLYVDPSVGNYGGLICNNTIPSGMRLTGQFVYFSI